MKKNIPNFITCLNLFSGCIAVYFAFQGNYAVVLLFVFIAAFFDFLDGLMARLFNVPSALGKELDSLSDVVSFGLTPGAIAFSLLQQTNLPFWLAFTGFLLPIFSALRLAKFNLDTRQTNYFLGLPTPAHTIFWAGLSYSFSFFFIENYWITLILIVLFSGLLVSEIPMFSLKFKTLRWEGNEIQYIFILVSIVLFAVFLLDSFSLIICWYILLSLLTPKFFKE